MMYSGCLRNILLLVFILANKSCYRHSDPHSMIGLMKDHRSIELTDYAMLWSENGFDAASEQLRINGETDASKRVFWFVFSFAHKQSNQLANFIYTSVTRPPSIWDGKVDYRRIHFYLTDSVNGKVEIYAIDARSDDALLTPNRTRPMSSSAIRLFSRIQDWATLIWSESIGFMTEESLDKSMPSSPGKLPEPDEP